MVDEESGAGDGAPSADPHADASVDLDAALELLTNQRRRFVIYTLRDAPAGVIEFDDLVAGVVRMEASDSSTQAEDRRHRQVAADLHHWHIPVLEESGVVTYDDRSEIVQYEGQPTVDEWANRLRGAEGSSG